MDILFQKHASKLADSNLLCFLSSFLTINCAQGTQTIFVYDQNLKCLYVEFEKTHKNVLKEDSLVK